MSSFTTKLHAKTARAEPSRTSCVMARLVVTMKTHTFIYRRAGRRVGTGFEGCDSWFWDGGQFGGAHLCDLKPQGLELSYIYNRKVARKRVDWVPAGVVWTEKIDDVLNSNVDVVVELVGGLETLFLASLGITTVLLSP
jgi:hypothetical protein